MDSDSGLHDDPTHAVLIVLTGKRTVHARVPKVDDREKPCPLPHTGAWDEDGMSIHEFDKSFRQHGFEKVEAFAGSWITLLRIFALKCHVCR